MHRLLSFLAIAFLCFSTQINGQILTRDNASGSTILFLNHRELPSQDNKVDIIQDFIVEKLGLPHLRWQVRQAREDRNGIIFEMSSVAEAKEVLKQAKLLLDESKISIVPAMNTLLA